MLSIINASPLSEIKKSSKFVNYENYNGGTISLDNLKGKYVYIDIWASWCGDCLKGLPKVAEMQASTAGSDIQYLFLSVDKKHSFRFVCKKILILKQKRYTNNSL